MRNIELKLELRDPPLARIICRALGARHIATLAQTDTYYQIAHGRLKKRETEGQPTEWVVYERSNDARPRSSDYTLYSEAEAAERFGTLPMPAWVVVRKARELWLHANVRIHLDAVEGLGTFLEFEAAVGGDYDERRCHETLAELREALAPALGEPIAVGYADLLAGDEQGS